MKVIARIEVGKHSLDVSVSGAAAKRFDYDRAGVTRSVAWLRSERVTQATCEATGGYEHEMLARLRNRCLAVHVAHPSQVRAFARAMGRRAKTDMLDTQVLSRYGTVWEWPATPPPDPQRQQLREILACRLDLLERRVQESNRLETMARGATKTSFHRHIAWLSKEIARLDTQYRQSIRADEGLAEEAILYRSVRGVGELAAAILMTYLPELGHCRGKSLTALVGLVPWSCDSGQQRSYRCIRGGRVMVRRALYMAALSATRSEGEIQRSPSRTSVTRNFSGQRTIEQMTALSPLHRALARPRLSFRRRRTHALPQSIVRLCLRSRACACDEIFSRGPTRSSRRLVKHAG